MRAAFYVAVDRDDLRFAATTAGGLLLFGVVVGILYPAPAEILFLGVVLGSLSALVAMGLVLVYRANRIVNFAQGDIGGLAGVLAASLIVGPEWPFFAAVAVGLVAAVALGALIEVAFIRRFAKAPRLVLTVATIGIAQLLQAGELLLPRLFSYDVIPQPPQPFSFRFEWATVVFTGAHLLIVAVVPLVALGLIAFFRRTDVGVGVRAAAESADRASLLGIPVRRLNTLVWLLAGGLSGLAVLLRLPIQGVSIGTVLGPSLMLRGLAAAVIGRMESLPRTFVAALALGVIDQAVLSIAHTPVIVDAVLFAVIIGALVVQRRGSEDRARDLGASTWQAIREVRPIPRELSRLPEVRIGGVAGSLALGLFLVLAPLRMSTSQVNLFGVGLILAMVMCSLVLLTGWAGQISLGQLAVVAFGAAVAGSLSLQGRHFFVCVAVAGVVGAAVSVAIGIPALRIKGPFLAVTTLAFAVACGTFFLNNEYFDWLVPDDTPGDRVLRPVLFDKFDLEKQHTYYFVILGFFVLTCAVIWRVRTSRTGRVLVATRDNSRAAQSFGISPIRAQLTAFAMAGAIAGVAGAIYAYHQHGISSTLLVTENNLKVFSIGVIGGLGSLPGALLAAAYLTFVDYSSFTREPLSRLFASGFGVLLILLIKPGGLGGLAYEWRDALLRRVARRREIVVPSLLADVAADPATPSAVAAGGDGTAAAPTADALLAVRGLDVRYGRTQVLFGVDFHVAPGEIVALLGTNGAGKSTLLGAIAGLVPVAAGTVRYAGRDVTGRAAATSVADGIVLMPGGKGVFPTLTVAENLRLAGWTRRDDPGGLDTAIEDVLGHFPVLRERWDQRAGNLSGGEQQMLTLGQALLLRPKLLMIDELSLGLAPVVVERLLGIVEAIHEQGTTVVLVEQSVNVAVTLADRAVFMEKGEVRFDGPTGELLERPEILRAVFLGAATDRVAGESARPATHLRFASHCDHCGREHRPAIELAGITAAFGGVLAVNDVDLSVLDGQIVGIIGPNGAGKTTVLDVLSGFVVPRSGRVLLDGTDVTDLAPDGRSLLGLGRSFQDGRLFPSMTVRQAIATALERHVRVRDPWAAFVLSPAVKASESEVDAEVDRLVELMRLDAYADKFVGELSTGTRRIVDLACAVAHRPSVLLLDEPSSGIAQRESEALGPVLLDIRDTTGAALVVIEHDMPLVTSIADELVAMELGSVICRGEPDVVIRDRRVVEGYLGGSEEAILRSGSATASRRRMRRRQIAGSRP